MKEVRVLTPCAGLGYGFPEKSINEGMKKNPHIIAIDAGSSDPGPHYLGTGEGTLSWQAQKKDLEALMRVRQEANIPLVVGTAFTAGAKPHVDKTVEIVKEIARENGYKFKLARIAADIDKSYLKRSLQEGRIKDFEHPKSLSEAEIDRSRNIVGQMGIEPHIEALKTGADVIIAGRSYDPAVVAALPIMEGFDPGLAIHMGKILECGAYAAEPSSAADSMFGTIRENYFIVEPPNADLRCTLESVAAHTLYEKESPIELHLPGGMIDLKETVFEAINEREVKVSKTMFRKADKYTIKLEGAARVGYRSLFIAGVRDPIFIKEIDHIIETTKRSVKKGVTYSEEEYQLIFRVYGKNGVMMGNEPVNEIKGHELGIVGEVVANTQEAAHVICSFAHGVMLHYHYPGRKTVAGNLAFPYSPADFNLGEVFEFNVYHLLEVDDPSRLFPIIVEDI